MVPNNSSYQTLSLSDVKGILTKALHLTHMTQSLKPMLNSPLFCAEHIPFMASEMQLFSSEKTFAVSDANDKLDTILLGMEALQIHVEGDGNCCFVATCYWTENDF